MLSISLSAQQAPISFSIINVESHVPPNTPWMFDLDSDEFPTSDQNPFTYVDNAWYAYHNYAYRDFYSTSAANPPFYADFPYSSECTEENLDFVDGTAGFSIEFDSYILTSFQHINTMNPGAAWSILGQAGDIRTYTNGNSAIYHNGELVLSVMDCVLDVKVHYPNAEQIREATGINVWVTDVGSGLGSEVSGWGIVDIAASDPDWVAEFADPNVGNRIIFEMSSVNNVLQGMYGYYTFDLQIKAAEEGVQQVCADVEGPGTIDFAALDLSFDFATVDYGGPNEDLDDLLVFLTEDSPEGIFPAGIESTYPRYWQFGTTLDAFTTDITFTVEDFGESNFWQVLRRGELEDNWQVWNDITILNDSQIKANNVDAFSQWTIGSSQDNTLPIVLSSFTAISHSSNEVLISWTTESESNIAGFRIFRAESENLNSALQISDFFEATNGSQTHTYQYKDTEVFPGNTYHYWLQQSDMNLEDSYHGPISVMVSGGADDEASPGLIEQNSISRIFPNPARSATIDVCLIKDAKMSIMVYNLKGQKIKTLCNANKAKGRHSVVWDGKDLNNQYCPAGIYFIKLLVDNNAVQVNRFCLNN